MLGLPNCSAAMRQVPYTPHVSMKHICLKALLVGQVTTHWMPVGQMMVTWKMEDGFGDFEAWCAHAVASGDYFLCGGSSTCGPGNPAKPHTHSGKSFSGR